MPTVAAAQTCSHRRSASLAAGLSLLFAGSIGLLAQEPQAASEDLEDDLEIVTHFIRPGDTLSEITEELLGSTEDWPRNLDLNPGYRERQLQPGARLRVLIDPARHPNAARIEQRAGTVDGQPRPLRWTALETRDLLLENDAARTGSSSSTELVFGDGMSITVAEDSLVFLRKLRDRLVVADASEVEVVEGQADLALDIVSADDLAGVDIVLGGATLAVPGARAASVRAGRSEDGASEASVYEGEPAAFSSPDGNLELPAGTGVIARANEAPVAETLLPAPTSLEPSADTPQLINEPIQLSWLPPDGDVASVTVELCRDPRCGQLIRRWSGLLANSLQLDPLAEGIYHWRVTAIAPSGLDGYPSEALQLLVEPPPPVPVDDTPPQVQAALVSRPIPYAGRRVVGALPLFDVQASDDDGEEPRWSFVEELPNGQGGQAPGAAWSAGRHRVAVEAVDLAGNRSRSDWFEFDVEASLPTFETRTLPSLPLGVDGAVERIAWSVGGSSWQPLDSEIPVSVMSEPFTLVLRAGPGRCLASVATAEGDGDCETTWSIAADDAEVGMRQISARFESGNDGEFAVVEAQDRVGNRSERRFVLRRP